MENILFAAIMVIVVAAADLSLPDLLSQIINVGIQQRGIQSAVPNALSVITMQDLQALQTQEEHARLLSFYELIEPGTPPWLKRKRQRSPAWRKKPFIYSSLLMKRKNELEDLIAKPLVFIQSLNMIQSNPEQARSMLGENFPPARPSTP